LVKVTLCFTKLPSKRLKLGNLGKLEYAGVRNGTYINLETPRSPLPQPPAVILLRFHRAYMYTGRWTSGWRTRWTSYGTPPTSTCMLRCTSMRRSSLPSCRKICE